MLASVANMACLLTFARVLFRTQAVNLKEKIAELTAQVHAMEKVKASDAANLRQYINENDTLRKRCALCGTCNDGAK